MRTATLQDAVDLFPLCEVEAGKVAALFDSFAPVTFKTPGRLAELTHEGWLTCEQVSYNGEPAFALWWCKTADDGLAVNACYSYGGDAPVDAAFIAAERIKTREGCRFIRFASVRKGLLEVARRHGYEFETIVMSKA